MTQSTSANYWPESYGSVDTSPLIKQCHSTPTVMYIPLHFQSNDTEFPIVSSSSSTLEEPVWEREEPNEYLAKRSQLIFLRWPQKSFLEAS